MKLIVGLGNPGKEYEKTRHNMGYMVVDEFAEMAGLSFDKSDFKGVYGILRRDDLDEPVVILKPETFMNNSGESVQPLMDYYKINIDDLVVVYDDMAIEPGKIRLKPFGSSGAHNGMRSIISRIGSENFKRIRVGIGEPKHTGVDWVLGKPAGEEKELIEKAIHEAASAIKDYLFHDWDYAMNHHNSR